jgi:glycosyltransferase involved in cell wall biosynthesis
VRSLHILHVITGLDLGGAETALARLVAQSSDSGIRHTVLSLAGRGDLGDAIEAGGGTVLASASRSLSALPRALLKPPKHLREHRPDIIQGWMLHGNLAAWLLRTTRFRRSALAWNLRMTLDDAMHERRSLIWATRKLANLSGSVDLLVANSEASLNEHLAAGYRPRRTAVIANGFDLDLFTPQVPDRQETRAAWGLAEDALAFGLIGRYHPTKGHALFIRAAARVKRQIPEAMFVLAGTDTDVDAGLGVLIQAEGLASSFLRLGARKDVPAVMRGLDVVCVPSDYESFPNVLGEAMASARPTIATDVADVSVIMGDAGKLIDVGDVDDLTAAMLEMAEIGPEGRAQLGAEGRKRVLDRYTLAASASRYAAEYRALVAERPL